MGGPECTQHTGPPLPAIRSAVGTYICHVCTPLGRTPEQTWVIVQREIQLLNSPYWS
ncbi:hypothetical protein GKQ77_01530 [Streptomyces sp. BG9H]|uniref:Uncharacterized protein n=1 Tax=Streptomyces anatolicus TaxID=2675858 RepID=A0ABS6YI44_9ACTN|nr:hypothetical protein [Streptomyces anatolicus]MBW5420251.1 hypothetical protein [Streptomyces anatolicus]